MMQSKALVLLVILLVRIALLNATGIISGDTIFLRSHRGSGHHVDVENDLVQARYVERAGWQSLVIEKDGGGAILAGDTVFLKTHSGTFIHVQDADVRANWYEKGAWQSFTIQKSAGGIDAIHPGDVVCFLAHTGHHIDVEGTSVQARYHDCGGWQQLMVQQELPNALPTGATVFLRSHAGHHIDVEGEAVQSRWVDQGTWQKLVVETHSGKRLFSGDIIFLRSHTGNYIHVENDFVAAHWQEQGAWQSLTIEKAAAGPILPGDTIFLRSHTGNYLDVQGDANGVVRCRWSDHGTWQSFIVELRSTSSSTSLSFLSRSTTTSTVESTFAPTPEPADTTTHTTITTTMVPICDAHTRTSVVGSMTTECQALMKVTHSYEEMCQCYLEVPNSTASTMNCGLLQGDVQDFHQTYSQCKEDFEIKEKTVWNITKSNTCCNHNKIPLGNYTFTWQSAEVCGSLALKDGDCNPNLVFIKSSRGCDAAGAPTWCGKDRCYCVQSGYTCQSNRPCSGWDVWAPQKQRIPAPAPTPTVSPTGYITVRNRYCSNHCTDVIAQYPPYQKNATECEQLCNANPRCKLYDMAHCGHMCILLTHCAGQKMSHCSSKNPGGSLNFRPDWVPQTVTLGSPGYLVGGQGIWGKPASECGSNVYGDDGKGRCDLGLARSVGRISICESKNNCIASNITSAQACAQKAALISFCAKDYIEWRTSNSNCYCTPVGHSYKFSTVAGGHRIYPMTAEEPN